MFVVPLVVLSWLAGPACPPRPPAIEPPVRILPVGPPRIVPTPVPPPR